MIVKIHSRGSGGGKGPVQYLLGKDGERADARLDQGNPSEVIDLIDGLKYAQKYTSGVLSFAESDISERKKQVIMRDFEKTLFPGLDKDQYSILWVQHLDKGRLELNFVVPNVELLSGKRLQPYYDRADRVRVNAFKVVCNAAYGLADPDDPIRRKLMITPSDLPRAVKDAREDIKDGILHLVQEGVVKNHADVLQTLTGAGFEISAIKTSSISIKNPNGEKNARPIALRGPIFSKGFDFSQDLQSEIEGASRRYQERAKQRREEALKTHRAATAIKREYHLKRFERPKEQDFGVEQSNAIAAVGVTVRSPSVGLGVVSIPESGSDITSGAANMGEVHSGVGVSLPDQGEKIDDGIGKRIIISCREIGKRAGERTQANGLAGEIVTANSGRVSRAIRSIGQTIEHAVGSIKLALYKNTHNKGPSGPSFGR